MLLVDDLAAGGTKNLRHTPRGLVTLQKNCEFLGLSTFLCYPSLPANFFPKSNDTLWIQKRMTIKDYTLPQYF